MSDVLSLLVSEASGPYIEAIEAGNLVHLADLLRSHEEEDRRPTDWKLTMTREDFNDKIVDDALVAAANVGCLESCRLLYAKLTPSGKQVYSNDASDPRELPPLHMAIEMGHLHVVRFFKEKGFNFDKANVDGATPLCLTTFSEERSRFLLESGANPNGRERMFGDWSENPLPRAIISRSTAVVRLLLVEYGADPNFGQPPAGGEDGGDDIVHYRNSDFAILYGDSEILSMLLRHGAFVGHCSYPSDEGTSLNFLLRPDEDEDLNSSRETRLDICRLLSEHSQQQGDSDTVAFLQASLEHAIKNAENYGCAIFLEAGMDLRSIRRAIYIAIQAENLTVARLLVGQHGVDPFLPVRELVAVEAGGDDDDDDDDDNHATAAPSPFLAAAREENTAIFYYFLGLWNERNAATGGKNSDGDYPLHVICRDSLVSVQAIELLVERQAHVLSTLSGGEDGLFPFHSAAIADAELDVIFCLLHHCPDALRRAVAASSSLNGSNQSDLTVAAAAGDDADGSGPVNKKAKTAHSK